MSEFFIVANSKAAPFFSDTSKKFKVGLTPEVALAEFRRGYSHPCGLFSAGVWWDANAYEKGAKPLAVWHSEEAEKQKEKEEV